jgi:hypothetical protein
MDDYTFSLAKHDDFSEIMDLYHSLMGTPGCTWHSHYPNRDIVVSDIENDSLYVLRDNDRIIAVAAAGVSDELDALP